LVAAVVATTAAIAVPATASAAAPTQNRSHSICLIQVPIFGGCAFSVPAPHLPDSVLTGTAQEGQVLTCGNSVTSVPVIGGLLNALPKTWRFQNNGSQVQSGGSALYSLGESDIGDTITCTLQIGGSICIPNPLPFGPNCFSLPIPSITSAASPGRGPVTSANLVNTGAPSISGSGVEGTTLTCNNGSFSPSSSLSHSYSWFRSGVLGAVSTGQTRTVSAADAGNTLTCRDTATRHGKTAIGTSAPKAATASPISNTALPTISGGSQDGQGVTCNPGSWSQTPESSSYEWLRNGSVIASGASYTLSGADVGQQVACRENVSRLGVNNSADSAAITPSAKPVVNNPGTTNPGTSNPGTSNPGTSNPVTTPNNTAAAKKKALAKKRAAAIKKCNKKFKKSSQRKKRAACVKKAKKKFAFKG